MINHNKSLQYLKKELILQRHLYIEQRYDHIRNIQLLLYDHDHVAYNRHNP